MGYTRYLTQLFEKHYLAAAKFAASGDYVLARESLLKSISFHVYQNDVKLHRAVVLVMLRAYINDVIGKITVINQHLANERLKTKAQAIFDAYGSLSSTLDLRDWNKVLGLIQNLRQQVSSFETEAQSMTVDYPSAFAQLDSEIQAAIQKDAAPNLAKSVNFKALLIDLDLKEKVAKQNTAEALAETEKQYEQAFHFIDQKNWQEARKYLDQIAFPPELADDAKKKIELIDKLIAADTGKDTSAASK